MRETSDVKDEEEDMLAKNKTTFDEINSCSKIIARRVNICQPPRVAFVQ